MRTFCIITILSVFSLVACGGGGGGGSGGGRPSNGARLLHGSIDYAPVTFSSAAKGADPLLETPTLFGEVSPYTSLGTGETSFAVSRVAPYGDVLATVAATIEKGTVLSVLLYEPSHEGGANVAILSDPAVEVPESQSALRIVHAIADAPDLSLTLASGTVSAGLGGASGYLTVAAGAVDINVQTASGSSIYRTTLALAPNGAYTLLIAGERGAYLKGTLAKDN